MCSPQSSRQHPTAPPTTIRGAQTPPEAPAADRAWLGIDWLSGTYPDGTAPTEVLPAGADLSWVELPHGGYHYSQAIALGHIRAYHGGDPGMGTHIVMSGQGCREAEALGLVGGLADSARGQTLGNYGGLASNSRHSCRISEPDWPALSRWADGRGFKARRLDVAMDDRSGLLDIDTMRRYWDDGRVVSRWKTMDERRPRRKGGAETGHGLYFGQPGSGTRLRVYDKALEQGLPAGQHWVRVELQLTGEAAERVWRLIGQRDPATLGALIAELILGRLRFVERTRSRVERCPTAAWWCAFLGEVAGRQIGAGPERRTLADLDHWIDQAVMPALALSVAASGGDMGVLFARLRAGRARWKAWHRALLAAAA